MAIAKKSASHRLSVAAMELISTHPFLATILMRLKREPNENLARGTMSTDGECLYYSPSFVDGLTGVQLRWLLAHEVMHVVQKASIRMRPYFPNGLPGNAAEKKRAMLLNIALDLAANCTLENAQFEGCLDNACVPGRGQFLEIPPNQTAEWYFDYLTKDQEQQEEKDGGKGDGDKKTGDDTGGDQDNPDGKDKEDERGGQHDGDDGKRESGGSDGDTDGDADKSGEDDSGTGGDVGENGEGQKPAGEEGGKDREDSDDGVDGEDKPEEGDGDSDANPDGDGADDDGEQERDMGGRAAVEMKLADIVEAMRDKFGRNFDVLPNLNEEETENTVNQALAVASSMGCGKHCKDYLLMAINKELEPPKIPWQRALKMFLTAREKSTPSYARPSRRRAHLRPFIFPTRNNPTLGNCVFLADTSGSMVPMLDTVASELYSLVASFPRAKLTIVEVDTAIRNIWEVQQNGTLPPPGTWKWSGGGGTELTPGFLYAKEKGATVVICATDLLFTIPPDPGIPVIWVVPQLIVDAIARGFPKPLYGNIVAVDDTRLTEIMKQTSLNR